ncbi:MAG: histidinol-phosphate transaminase [Candidatus Thermoplasmatota archaeon]|nr:histidinol-phosphate transaminase [Candidatus Thermoplasmatota archaeon]
MSENVKKLRKYQPSVATGMVENGSKDFLKLDWNESCQPPSSKVKKALVQFIKNGKLNYYPDIAASKLVKSLSKFLKVGQENIVVFNGSDNATAAICFTYLEKGDKILIRRPTYTQIDTYLAISGAKVVDFLGKDPFSKALDIYTRMLVKHKPKVVYMVNPNNPTGVMYSRKEVSKLLKKFPKTLFFIDEAYIEFAGKSLVPLTKIYKNLIISRSFSKAFALAGLRIGYLVSNKENIQNISKVRNGKDVNLLAQVAATISLSDLKYMKMYVANVLLSKRWLIEKLRALGVEVYDTPANFVLIKTKNAKRCVDNLAQHRVFVRDRSSLPQLDGFFRVTVGGKKEVRCFLDAYKKICLTQK